MKSQPVLMRHLMLMDAPPRSVFGFSVCTEIDHTTQLHLELLLWKGRSIKLERLLTVNQLSDSGPIERFPVDNDFGFAVR